MRVLLGFVLFVLPISPAIGSAAERHVGLARTPARAAATAGAGQTISSEPAGQAPAAGSAAAEPEEEKAEPGAASGAEAEEEGEPESGAAAGAETEVEVESEAGDEAAPAGEAERGEAAEPASAEAAEADEAEADEAEADEAEADEDARLWLPPPRRLPPAAGSQLAAEDNSCVTCHGEAELWEGEKLRLHVSLEGLADDVHWQKGVNCHDCHGGDPQSFDVPVAHSTNVPADSEALPFRDPLAAVKKVCPDCHQEQAFELRKGVHAHAGEKNQDGSRAILACTKCHGEKAHGILPVRDIRAPVYLDHQVGTCGGCHEDHLATYMTTVHGTGLTESGLVVTAVCADCHGAHGIYYAADRRSTLHSTRVAGTCGACHRFMEERILKSVHGRGAGPGTDAAEPAPGGKQKRKPSCTDCHVGHELRDPESALFRHQLANRCGNCHPDMSSRYAMSMHGELTQLGYTPAAKCSDCHGAHDILPLNDPNCPLAKGKNRLATCRKCHIYAVQNFANFDPHANHKDAAAYPLLHLVHVSMNVFLHFFFFGFLIHAFLWFVRAFVQVLQGGRHKTLVSGSFALVRYETTDRILYGMLMTSFLGLTLTGLPLKYGSQQWAQSLAWALGGFQSTSVWHHFFAAVAIFGCATHLLRAFRRIVALRDKKVPWQEILFGPDSLVLNLRDVKDFLGMLRWFVGLGPKPGFERWTYWEKFDYWLVYLVGIIIGTSGLLLWYPNLFCRVLPGGAINAAKVVHAETAILAASFLFIFHFFHTHFRPEKFPLDLSAVTGLVSEEHLKKHRPDYIERLRRTGRLDKIRRPIPSRRRLGIVILAGAVLFLIGLGLLALVLVATLGK